MLKKVWSSIKEFIGLEDNNCRFEYYRSKKEWRFRFKAENNRILFHSGEGYTNLADCLHAIQIARKKVRTADVVKKK